MSSVLPILFNTDMVRAIPDGHKRATRRVVKGDVADIINSQYHKEHPKVPDKVLIEKLCRAPYETGDILYIRETWAFMCCLDCMEIADAPECTCMLGKTSTIHEDKDSASISIHTPARGVTAKTNNYIHPYTTKTGKNH